MQRPICPIQQFCLKTCRKTKEARKRKTFNKNRRGTKTVENKIFVPMPKKTAGTKKVIKLSDIN